MREALNHKATKSTKEYSLPLCVLCAFVVSYILVMTLGPQTAAGVLDRTVRHL